MLWDVTASAVLGVAFVASVVHQFRRGWWLRIARFDVLYLLPRWSFFAPNPGHHDLHVVYRDWQLGAAGGWRELRATPTNPVTRWFWNPDRFARKAVFDMTSALLGALAAEPETQSRTVLLTSSYIHLLGWVLAQEECVTDVSARQFAIVRSSTTPDARHVEIAYVSELHPVVAG